MQPAAFSLLRALNAGGYHDRAALARALQLAPEAVDAAATALRAQGVACRHDAARGYALTQACDLLDADSIQASLRVHGARLRVCVRDQCASTNAALRACAVNESVHGIALACELQSAGRGRRGNPWYAGLADALTFTVGWRFAGPVWEARALGGLPLAVAVGCLRGLRAAGVHGVALKWPNDLLHDGAKLGGILIEAVHADADGVEALIGIGINVHGARAAHGRVAQPVACLDAAAGKRLVRSAVLAALLVELEEVLMRYAQQGFGVFRDEWLRQHAFEGRRVRIEVEGHAPTEGVAAGVAEDGALQVRTAAGVRCFRAGEVSLREAA